jgi:hypothetical protein
MYQRPLHLLAMRSFQTALILALVVPIPAPWFSDASERPDPKKKGGSKGNCIGGLTALGAVIERPAAIPASPYPACKIVDPVILISAKDPTRPGKSIIFHERPLLSCKMAARLATFSVSNAAPLAKSFLGHTITSISTGPGYECRPRNRQAGAKISSHGQGNAIDIATIKLEGGRIISIEKPDKAATIQFLTALRFSACTTFNTVLGPGADDAHANHIHLDLEPRGKTGSAKFCQ